MFVEFSVISGKVLATNTYASRFSMFWFRDSTSIFLSMSHEKIIA